MSLLAHLLAVVLLVAVQGVLLQASCSVAGARPPRPRDALVTALSALFVASLGSVVWAWSFGLVVGLLSGALAAALKVVVAIALTAGVYRAHLGLGRGQAFVIALTHQAMARAIAAAIWTLLAIFG